MKILFSIHLYPPKHLCGAEFYAHNMAKELIAAGHEVRVWLNQWYGATGAGVYYLDGVMVWPPTCSNTAKDELFQLADIVLTHLDFTQWTIWKTKQIGKPCVFITHNTSDFYDTMVNSSQHVSVIYNCEHAREELNYNVPSMVMEPPIDMARIKIESNTKEFYTLINICDNKGVRQFYEMARLMPDKQFLGVKGSYMEQELSDLPNVTIWEKQTDIRKVYERTAVLLMPSDYESFGMTASEALANGIPVICSPTPGLKENCGDGAQYCERNNVQKWVSLLRSLEKPTTYAKWSAAGLRRTTTRPKRFNQLESFLNECIIQRQIRRA